MAEMTRAQVENIVRLARQKREMAYLSGVDLTEAACSTGRGNMSRSNR